MVPTQLAEPHDDVHLQDRRKPKEIANFSSSSIVTSVGIIPSTTSAVSRCRFGCAGRTARKGLKRKIFAAARERRGLIR